MALFTVNASARKPAVEDFVGVETEDYRPTSEGTEVLFDFGNLVDKKQIKTSGTGNLFPFSMIVAFIFLPVLMWFAITGAARKGNKESSLSTTIAAATKTTTQDTSNVENLSEYKEKIDSKKKSSDIKKAS